MNYELWRQAVLIHNSQFMIHNSKSVAPEEGDSPVYLRIHDNILVYKRDFFAISLQELFQYRGCACRAAELDALCSVHQLDSEDMIQVIHDLKELGRGIGSHADVIFLPVARHDRVAAGSIAVHLVLAHHAGSPHTAGS